MSRVSEESVGEAEYVVLDLGVAAGMALNARTLAGALPTEGAGYTLSVGCESVPEFRIILPTKEREKLYESGFEGRQWLLSMASLSNKM